MSLIIRPANLDDTAHIVPYIKMASGGFSDFLLTNLVQNMTVDELIEMALTDENTTYYYQQFLVAEVDHAIVGAGHFYPAEQHGLSDLMRSIIPAYKLDIIAPYFNSYIPHSMYIHAMAIAESHRTSLCSVLLGKKIEGIAKMQKKRCLSAHVWEENTPVYEGLKVAGFKEITSFTISPQPEFTYGGRMILMKGPDFD